ncbi:MAG: ABC transporter permease [Gemmatimonadota bacterium]|jgi:ABC-2 type transport system permease protein|nr:MAG: ABC transporter permease [Gemmatimonadota bacterium]
MAVARKEVIQLRRDPRSLVLAFLLPLLLVLIFAYATTLDVRDVRLGVLDRDRTAESRLLVDAFEESGYFSVRRHLERYGDVDRLLVEGKVSAVLVIPRDFAVDLAAGRAAPVQLLLDGSDANTATIALGYADAITAGFAADAGRAGALRPPVEADARVWYNETLESRNMIVPGLIAVLMSIIAAMLTSLTIAREWERGTMEQLVATPVHRLEVVFGKLLPYIGIGLVDVALASLVSMLLFDVPLRGSVPFLLGTTLLFLLGAQGLGIFLSAALRSQVLATQAAIMVTYLPALLLSGFIFAIANMPSVLRLLSYVVPARYYIEIARGVFLKGVGPDALAGATIGLALYSLLGIGLAVRAFRKEIA